jgi:hypothetical protein
MLEPRRSLVTQDARRGEPVGERLGIGRIEIGKQRCVSQLDTGAKDRDGARETLGVWSQGGERAMTERTTRVGAIISIAARSVAGNASPRAARSSWR